MWVRRSLYERMKQDLTDAKIATVSARLDGIDTSVRLVAHQAEKKNEELNDVRRRFIPRETFEQFVSAQSAKTKATLIAMATMGITVAGIYLSR